MKLGLVIENLYKNGKYNRSFQTDTFIPWFAKNHSDTVLINPLDASIDENKITVQNIVSEKISKIPIKDLDCIYFGIMGQKNIYEGHPNALFDNMPYIGPLFDIFKNNPDVKIQNPIDTMLWNMSKQYLIDLQDSSIPVTETFNITSLEELRDLSKEKNKWVIKPKVAERAAGTIMSSDLDTEEKLNKYANNYLFFEKIPGDNSYAKARNCQGIILQEVNPDFVKYGEKKIYVVNGNITVSRRNVAKNNVPEDSLEYRDTMGHEKYYPTDEEKELSIDAYNSLIDLGHDISYVRVDIVGDGTRKNTQISELELINPGSNSGRIDTYFTKSEVDYHNRSILEALKNKA